ncbi:MAG: indole-3-glycerol phosphate synthase TrpC [Clostridiales Family XIII bacterium]|jgi:indole-3-glycerol phosphate synthase|nr:indole-3-glycerol phosphate synthase TrpC [Clostridiales Family XIII bacterium]
MMKTDNILERLAVSAEARVAREKAAMPLSELERLCESKPTGDFAFETALKAPGLSFVCEVKRASPSKGMIAEHFPYLSIARDYASGGAAGLSVLTEPEYFLGSDAYLGEIAAAVPLPVLRKDFTVDIYQIYQAKVLGARAVLLICAILDESRLREFLACANALGLSALTEVHDEKELDAALRAGARMIGVNNRDLRTFAVDPLNCLRLRASIPPGTLCVAESGIATRADAERLAENGVDAVLVGEALMRAPDRKAALQRLMPRRNTTCCREA